MPGDGDDGDLTFAGAVVPEDPIGGRGLVLGVGLEDVLAARTRERLVLLRVEAGMAEVRLQQSQGLADGLPAFG